MASIRVRERKDGGITYTVTWRDGGARTAKQESEKFDDIDSAERFQNLVDGFGQQWPPGWIRGRGFVEETPAEPEAEVDPETMFEAYALKFVDLLTGVQGGTKAKYRKMIEHSMVPWFRDFSVADGELSITSDAIKLWVNDLGAGRWGPHPPEGARKRRKHRAKTIRDEHGLLSSIMKAAVVADLRAANPCDGTRLPRTDDTDADEMCFLEHWEYALIHKHLKADAADLVELAVGTGIRWGELSALQKRDIVRRNGRPALRIQRTWKLDENGARYMGPPKTKKSRRTIVLTARQSEIVQLAARGKAADGLLFLAPQGGAWLPVGFRRQRWLPAIAMAQEEGLTKSPRMHDLRHTHASWMIAGRLPLPALQARLGHESIQTTVDEYGHLLSTLDEEVITAVDAAFSLTLVAPPADVVLARADLAEAA
ncbi:hypothetical protein GCM10009760_18830 [Kitasatospora kazusensis]|uniref:Tyr recombinase domain-containing protein n=1 Tax=Kitasatospora kazusensis TaxID=407974 RepID=A0ABP5KYM3_9ACTN